MTEVAPPPSGRYVSEGEDFSVINQMLARLRELRPSATAPAKPAPAGEKPEAPKK